ncbi:Respiratory-chain NADH dehydrogenase, subunit [Methylobacterium sp. UNC378MF]|nr:Respiratory-chain NADH dehydrogenase, subunit [Methylobacterium sp. UNC378MF]
MEWGFSGVMVRGSGIPWDLRKAQPYECYEEMEFDIPVGKNGDTYDRQVIRMEEMRQSVRIMKQCVAKLREPAGQEPIAALDGTFAPPPRRAMKRSMEALIRPRARSCTGRGRSSAHTRPRPDRSSRPQACRGSPGPER